nr:hypothetical protein [Anaerolineae bacterium]
MCANKNPNGMIVRVGGMGWSLSISEAVVKIMNQQLRLHILLDNQYHDIGVRSDSSDAYLVLEENERPLHDIDGLPSC